VVACTVGLLFYQGEVAVVSVHEKPWFWGTFALGLLFIIVFNLMAATSQRLGVSVASVATKMSLVLPVLFGVLYYKEVLGPFKILGILLALAAVYFASIKERTAKFKFGSLLLPFFVFTGSGVIDISLAFFQKEFITDRELPLFSASIFASAAVMGVTYILIGNFRKPLKINFKNILGGIALGVPNYFSIYFLLRALQNDTLNSASVFTVNNVAIVMFSTLLGILLFKEKLSRKNWAGIILAVISIILVTR
jgi:drug/metabolite transporter (DMT)-like permease